MDKPKVLLIDDEKDFVDIMSACITEWGYDVAFALDGKSGIEALKKELPDIVVLDYLLPDADGVAVLAEIRKLDKDIPVIMLTAYPSLKVIDEAGKLNINAFIPKISPNFDIQTSLKTTLNAAARKLKKT